MQQSGPSLAPTHDAATYLVLDEFPDGRIYHETDEAEADRALVETDFWHQIADALHVIAC